MNARLIRGLVLLFLFGLPACTQTIFHWGEYEESLYLRSTDTSEETQAEALKMLELTIQEAEENQGRLAPGVYGDYGYLLFKQGRVKEAVLNFKKEATLYPESRYFMYSIISRIKDKENR